MCLGCCWGIEATLKGEGKSTGDLMTTHVLVIGGGAIGAAVAYFVRLLEPGTEVTVVERDPGYKIASTPRASGGFRRLFSLPENIELSNFSIPFFDAFADTMAVDGVRPDI